MIISVFLCLNIWAHKVSALSSDDEYLWLELCDEIKEADGSIIQPLFINYGRYPDKKIPPFEIEGLEAIYTFGDKDKQNKDIFYKLDILIRDGRPYVEIISKSIRWCMVLIQGKRKCNSSHYSYFAKTSFFLFGKSDNLETGEVSIVPVRLNEIFDIKTYLERQKEDFTYNREKPFPIRMSISFDKKPFAGKEVKIIDKFGNMGQFKTDNKGGLIYFPIVERNVPDGDKDFDQDVAIARYRQDNQFYIATYTIPFGIRFSPFKKEPNIKLGISIFIAFFAIFFIIAVKERKKFVKNL